MAGQILGGHYQVERQLGKQTGRWTLLARDLETQAAVVIKLLFLNERLDTNDLRLFEREVEILQSLDHPAIPQYLGYFEHELPDDKALALIQTYVDGRSLEYFLQKGRKFTETEVTQLAKALLNILIYLHGRQPPIIHRDIKPSNIVLANRQAYLVDFGSVKALTGKEETANFTVVGTYGYMPPEQFSGRVMPASDLYSLGATLIALLAGSHPSSLPRKGTKFDLSGIADLSPAFANWLDWLTKANLEQRAPTAQAALESLENGFQLPNATPPTATPAPIAPPTDTRVTLTKADDTLEITIPSRLGQTQLRIDAQEIALTSKRLGFATGPDQTSPRKAIRRLEFYRPTAATNTDVPCLILWAAGQRYELGKQPPLSEAELEWLAAELSGWLKLPVR